MQPIDAKDHSCPNTRTKKSGDGKSREHRERKQREGGLT